MATKAGRCLTARAATPSGLSRFASSCKHRIAIAWARFREWLHPFVCNHEWRDEWVFANCVGVTIPTGERRPLGWQAMQSCEYCDELHRRQLTREEWLAWSPELLAAFEDGDEHLYMEMLPKPGSIAWRLRNRAASAGEAGTATTPKIGVVHEHAVAKPDAQTPA